MKSASFVLIIVVLASIWIIPTSQSMFADWLQETLNDHGAGQNAQILKRRGEIVRDAMEQRCGIIRSVLAGEADAITATIAFREIAESTYDDKCWKLMRSIYPGQCDDERFLRQVRCHLGHAVKEHPRHDEILARFDREMEEALAFLRLEREMNLE